MKTSYIFLLMLAVFITNTFSWYIPKYQQQIQNSEEMTNTMANTEQSKYDYFFIKNIFLIVLNCEECQEQCKSTCYPFLLGMFAANTWMSNFYQKMITEKP